MIVQCSLQGSTLIFLSTCPVGQVHGISTCPDPMITCPNIYTRKQSLTWTEFSKPVLGEYYVNSERQYLALLGDGRSWK